MLNLGIVAHVDAGKTSLTERLLYDSGAIARLGSVDAGSTTTDGMDLERRRGITIRSAVASFTTGDREVHLIDTPGHTDFVAEVERALGVLDGAVLVLSAVEGVQAHTRALMRVLRDLAVPTLLFVNKIDRRGARDPIADIRRALTPAAVALHRPVAAGTPDAGTAPVAPDEIAEVLAEHSDAVLRSYVEGLDPVLLRAELGRLSRAGVVHPVLFGSAITGAGIDALRTALVELLPSVEPVGDGPLDGTVFAVERGGGGRRAVVRLRSGSVGPSDRIVYTGQRGDGSGRVTAVLDAAGRPGRVAAGGIARVAGPDLRVGDRLGAAGATARPRFRPPGLETAVTAAEPARLFTALTALADEDPLIDVRNGDRPGELVVSLYGDVQREVLAARLAEEHGVHAEFSPTRVVGVRRLTGTGASVQRIGDTEPVFHWATVGLRVEPGPEDSGVDYRLGVERGSLPLSFLAATEEAVRADLRARRVVDCVVTLTHSGQCPLSVPADYRGLAPIVLDRALRQAGTVLCMPWDRVDLDVPDDALSAALDLVVRAGGLLDPRAPHGAAEVLALVPTERVPEIERALPGRTGGLGVLTARFGGYRPIG